MNNLIVKLMFGLLAVFVTSTMVAAAVTQVTGFDFETVRAAVMAGSTLAVGGAGYLGTFASASITAFNSEFGAYYQPRGQNAERLKKLLMQNDDAFSNQFALLPLEGDVVEYGMMSHTRVLQPYKSNWSPTGELSGTPRKFTLRRVKVDVEEIPDALVNTWLGFLTTEGGRDPNVDRTTWPFVRWYVERYLIPQAKQDQYYEAAYGVYAAPANNSTPGNEGTALDGIFYQLNLDIDNGDITAISTGALETDPELFVDQVEDFAEQIDNRYRGLPLVINMHDTHAQLFKQGMLDKYNMNYAQVGDGNLMSLRKRTNISVRGQFNWLLGPGGLPSSKFMCTPGDNLFKGVRLGNKEAAPMRVETETRTLRVFNDWHVGYSYWDYRIMFTNDQDLTYGGF
jgi:hypothetical protein